MRLSKSTLLLILFLSFTFVTGCDNPAALTPGSQRQNIVTGINITTAASPEVIAVWGNPNFPGSKEIDIEPQSCSDEECLAAPPGSFFLDNPYPNPTSISSNIPFQIPIQSTVTVWIESAEWIDEGSNPILPYHAVRPFQRYVLIDNQNLAAGWHTIGSGTSNRCIGGDTYPGFYRVYIQAGDYLSWRDIYIYGPVGTNPPGLASYSEGIFKECDPN